MVRQYAAGAGATGYGDYDPDEPAETEYTRLGDARHAYRQYQYTRPTIDRSTSGRTCANCERAGARHERSDSSGIPGWVCDGCNRDEDYQLSFA
ncbi:MAG: hypothetical protein V7603_5159 [Micromonosporaceae bacterium]